MCSFFDVRAIEQEARCFKLRRPGLRAGPAGIVRRGFAGATSSR
jgi:hypothetical protein